MVEAYRRRSPLAHHGLPARAFADAARRPAADIVLGERPHRCQVNLRGKAADPTFAARVASAIGLALPVLPNTTTSDGGITALWLGPDEWLLAARPGREAELLGKLHGRVRSLAREKSFVNRWGSTTIQKVAERILRPTKPRPTPPIGYARVQLHSPGKSLSVRVHVLVLEAFIGPRPDGLVACHGPAGISDNSVGNLRWDTYSSNNFDLVEHGTHWQVRKTECKHGHAFTPENTIIRAEGGRKCRTCQYAARDKWRRRKQVA